MLSRIIVYTVIIYSLMYLLPMHNQVKESNAISNAIWLRGDILAVIFPWKGILIKSGITGILREEVLEHEYCHAKQINRMGWFDFMVEYQIDSSEFERECYNK